MLVIKPKKKKAELLADGQHQVKIDSITESADYLIIRFSNQKGFITLPLPLNDKILGIIAVLGHYAGVREGKEVMVADLIGAKMTVNIINKQVKKITP